MFLCYQSNDILLIIEDIYGDRRKFTILSSEIIRRGPFNVQESILLTGMIWILFCMVI